MLKARLMEIAKIVPNGSIISDIGTDHGYLPVYLVEKGICKSAIAVDINEKPLNSAKQFIKHKKMENKIQTRLSNGLQDIKPSECDVIVIAGMGASLICNILQNNFIKHLFILQANTAIHKLREFLYKNNYKIIKENIVEENNIFYVIISAIIGNHDINNIDVIDDINEYKFFISKHTLKAEKADKYLSHLIKSLEKSIKSAEKAAIHTEKHEYLYNKLEILKKAKEKI